jgi:hypothetical protein
MWIMHEEADRVRKIGAQPGCTVGMVDCGLQVNDNPHPDAWLPDAGFSGNRRLGHADSNQGAGAT